MILDRLRHQWQRIAGAEKHAGADQASPPVDTPQPDRDMLVDGDSGEPGAPLKGSAFALEQLVPGALESNALGAYYVIRRRLAQCWTPNHNLATQFAGTMQSHARALQAAVAPRTGKRNSVDAEFIATTAVSPDALLFMDIESCGFAGNPLFLIGVMYWCDGDLVTEQILARSYEQEPQVLARFGDVLAGRDALITFNGKSFDWPFVCDRAAVHRVRLTPPTVHCDLLHTSRRRFRQSLPDCRLQTLESHLLGRRRTGDIPGSDIPAAYNDFVRTGDARAVREIVHHNFLDLVTMAELVIRIAADMGTLDSRNARS